MAIPIVSDTVLVESRAARENQLREMSHDRAQAILAKVKNLYFSLWKGTGIATTEQVADFYEVPAVNIRKTIERNRQELESDGLRVLTAKALKDVSDTVSLTSKTPRITIHTPRSTLRLGMTLEDSPIAKAVRTTLLDAVQHVIPALAHDNERLKLELALAQAQAEAAREQRLLGQFNQAVMQIHGSGIGALILGKPDALVERVTEVEKTVLCNERGHPLKTFRGLSKTKLAKRYGLKKSQDFVVWLHSLGKAELLQRGLTTTPCEFCAMGVCEGTRPSMERTLGVTTTTAWRVRYFSFPISFTRFSSYRIFIRMYLYDQKG